jgi:transcriptional regulator with PAS, ATPase and Fis domain
VVEPKSVHVLILDDQLELADPIRHLARLHRWQPHFVGSLQELELALHAHRPTALVLINQQPPLTSWELEQRLPKLKADAPVVVLSEPGGESGLGELPGVVCMERPRGVAETERRLAQVLNGLGFQSPGAHPHGIIGQSTQLHEVLARIEKAAPGDANVCISGESGTGKELIARAIHTLSARADRPLVTLDCTAIPETLIESHLFGHVRGSFTGAVENRTGFFTLAHTGTLFVDEISELSLPLQAKLLRAIQTREFVKVGDSKPTRTDIRLITASNKDLPRAVREGTFREDLYYRIAVVMVEMPPLRDRPGDIALLAEHFLRKFAAAHRKPVLRLLPRAVELLETYDWPGNVRQLENCLEQAVVLCEDNRIDVRDLPLGVAAVTERRDKETEWPSGLTLQELEHRHIVQTLGRAGNNRTQTAKLLGISLRCLQYKLKAYHQGSLGPRTPFDQACEIERSGGVG